MDSYTQRRIKELRGEKVYMGEFEGEIERYTHQRIQELNGSGDTQSGVDKSPLGCYTVSTMGDRDGET